MAFWGNLARAAEYATFSGAANSSAVVALNGAVAKFSPLSANLVVGDTALYCLIEDSTNNWQGGMGTYTAANQLTLTTCLQSSNANAAVTFGSGQKILFVVAADVATAIHNALTNAGLVDADELGVFDAGTGVLNKITWATVKSTLKAYFDAVYPGHFTGSSPPSSPIDGTKWLNTNDGIEYTYIDDGNTTQWVDLSSDNIVSQGAGVPTYVGPTQPVDAGTYFWVQTGLGSDGTGVTLNINI